MFRHLWICTVELRLLHMRSQFIVENVKDMSQDEFVKAHINLHKPEGVLQSDFKLMLIEWYQINVKPLRTTKKK